MIKKIINNPYMCMAMMQNTKQSYNCFVIELDQIIDADCVVYVITSDLDNPRPYIEDGNSYGTRVIMLGDELPEDSTLAIAQELLNESEPFKFLEFSYRAA